MARGACIHAEGMCGNMKIELRPHQVKAISMIEDALKQGYRRPLLCMPCGSGKTITAAEIMRRAARKHNETLFLNHVKELNAQAIETIDRLNIPTDYARAGMIITTGNHMENYKPKIIFADECNFSLSKSWRKVIDNYPAAITIGLSATPLRLSGEPMSDIYDTLIQPVTVRELMDLRLLSQYKYYSVLLDRVDFTKLKKRAGDYSPEELYQRMGRDYVYDDILKDFTRLAHDKKTIVFCTTIKHSEETAERFRQAGYRAEHIDANTPSKKRAEIVARFRTGETQILCNVQICTYGFDIPNCDCVALLRKTDSYAIFHQAVMRCMRPLPGKTALILDFVSNVTAHGLPDQHIEWDLNQGRIKTAANEVKIKTCPECYGVIPRNTLICPYCEYDFTAEVKAQQEKERIEAELQEIQACELERLKSMSWDTVRKMTTWEEIEAIRAARGYKMAWAVRMARNKSIEIPWKYQAILKHIKE